MKGKVGQRSHRVVIELCIVKFLSKSYFWFQIELTLRVRSTLKSHLYIISDLIIYLQNFQNSHWPRTCQFTPNISESRNWVKKVKVGCRKMNLKWLRMNCDSTTLQNGRQVRRKLPLFQFRVWGRILKAKTPNKGKQLTLSLASKSGHQIMNRRSWIKFLRSFTQQFVLRKTGKIMSVIVFVGCLLLSTNTYQRKTKNSQLFSERF